MFQEGTLKSNPLPFVLGVTNPPMMGMRLRSLGVGCRCGLSVWGRGVRLRVWSRSDDLILAQLHGYDSTAKFLFNKKYNIPGK